MFYFQCEPSTTVVQEKLGSNLAGLQRIVDNVSFRRLYPSGRSESCPSLLRPLDRNPLGAFCNPALLVI